MDRDQVKNVLAVIRNYAKHITNVTEGEPLDYETVLVIIQGDTAAIEKITDDLLFEIRQ